MSDNTGGPAFPYEERDYSGNPSKDHFGMTLRDYFAAKALQVYMDDVIWNTETYEAAARAAYTVADAMLKARNT